MEVSDCMIWVQPQMGRDGLRDLLLPGLVDLKLCLLLESHDRNIVYIANVPKPWALTPGETPRLETLFGADIAERLARAKDGLQRPGERTVIEAMAGEEQIFEFRVQAVGDDAGSHHYLTTLVDRTEERRRERLLKALLREVSHRTKNLMAIIQSLALQTARHSRSLDLFLQKFRGRLYSLSQSQDLITDSNWRGAGLFELVRQQTDKYLPENSDIIRIEGDDAVLSPNAALHLGLALHELVINAVAHGGLLVNGMTVTVRCEHFREANAACLRVAWEEPLRRSMLDGFPPREAHFGSTVLERVVPSALNGRAAYRMDEDAIRYEVSFPLESAA